MLEHVFAPFLECCCDAVMFAKRNVVLDDENDVSAMTIAFLLIKSCCGGYEMRFLWMSLECFRVFFAFICFCSMIESAANGIVVVVAMKLVCGG